LTGPLVLRLLRLRRLREYEEVSVTAQLQDTSLVLGPDWNGAVMTPEEFDSVEEWDEGFIYELIHGVIIVSPPPLEAERGPNDQLGHMLRSYREEHPEGRALDDTLPEHLVRVGKNRRRADRVIWAGLRRQPDPRHDLPAIVIEFVSAGKRNRRRDYVERCQEYAAAGIAEYWLIDRFRRTLTVYRADGTELSLGEADAYESALLPGFVLRISEILAAADRWT
jgi:Uma2 family endonuclease